MSSFNMEMDRYLERRSFSDKTPMSTTGSSKKDKKKKNRLSKIRDAIKVIFDADEVINLNNINDTHKVSYFDKKSFKSKLLDYFKKEKEENNDEIKIEESSSKNLNHSTKKEADNEKNSSVVNETFLGNSMFNNENQKKGDIPDSDTIPIEEVNKVLQNSQKDNDDKTNSEFEASKSFQMNNIDSSSNASDSSSDKKIKFDEFRDDLREVIKITYKIMKRVPPEAIREFRNSKDFKDYVEILDKYELLKKKPEDI